MNEGGKIDGEEKKMGAFLIIKKEQGDGHENGGTQGKQET